MIYTDGCTLMLSLAVKEKLLILFSIQLTVVCFVCFVFLNAYEMLGNYFFS